MIRRFAWAILAWTSIVWLAACLSGPQPIAFQPDGSFDDASFDSGYNGSTSKDSGGDATLHYSVGGTVSGLAKGATVVLADNGGDNLSIATNGSFSFGAPVASGGVYSVTVVTQPTGPTQLCTVTNGGGTASGNVTNVAVTCATRSFTIGGTVKGLTGTGLVLENNNADPLKVSANGTFTFATPVDSGNAFNVKVQTEPTGPVQTCTVSGGGGIVGSGAITGVVVNCATDTFTVGGQISGLGAGTVVLQNNAGDNLTVNANGSFAFATPVSSGAAYLVTVLTQPTGPSQTCTVTSGSGTVAGANVTDVRVACVTNAYTIRGTVTGLSGSGLVLQDNGIDNLSVNVNGAFSFVAKVLSGTSYKVTTLTEPTAPSEFCAIANGAGTVGGADVANVTVTCTANLYTVGVTVSGLVGSGLVLENNGGDDLLVSANGSLTFATSIASGQPYAVTVKSDPSNPTQSCTVTGGSGTVGGGNVTGIAVNCATDTFTVGGRVTGLGGATLVLQNNGGDDLTLKADGAFAFVTPVPSGTKYAVTVLANPTNPSESCVVTNGTGTVGAVNVSDVAVTCTTNAYTIGGTVTGLSGAGLVLEDNAGDDLAVGASGKFTFAKPVASGATFNVTVKSQPSNLSQTCTVTNGTGTGTVGGANVLSVTVGCTTNTYTVGGTVSGLTGKGLVLTNNAGDTLPLSANGSFAFATPVLSGGAYSVAVSQNPTGPTQSCVVATGTASGTVTSGNITTVAVTCATQSFTVGGTLSGLLGTGLVLQDNGGDALPVSANGKFTFKTSVASGAAYNVTIQTQPTGPTQSCSVSSGQGTVGGGAVTTITVNCATNAYTVSGTVSGLSGTGLVLQDNGGDNLAISQNGQFSFPTPVSSGGAYAVTVLTNPANPTEQCIVTNGTGSVTSGNVSGVIVSCAVSRFTVSGTLTGLALNETVVLQDNGADNLTVAANGKFTFVTSIPSNGTYAVTVLTNPTAPVAQACTVTAAGSGSVTNANITAVTVSCATDSFTVGGTVTGLGAGDTLVLTNGSSTLNITGGSFTFPAQASGTTYSVTATNPASPIAQNCTVANGNGTVANVAVTNVVVSCTTDNFTVGGTVSGLGAGDTLVLSNGVSTLNVTGSNFTFPAQASDTSYNVTVTNPNSPIAQTCTVANGSGTVGGANVTNVAITCKTNTYTVGGTVTGLGAGDTLVLTNGAATLNVTGANFNFPAQASGTAYAVTLTNPVSPIAQTCTVANGSGTVGSASVANVTIACSTNSYAVSGTVTGLGAGDTLALANGTSTLSVTGASFAFPAQLSGTSYDVTATNPSSPIAQTCTVANGSGTIANAAVTSVAITCKTNTYVISGTISGLASGDTLVVSNAGVTVNVTGTSFAFAAQASGTAYAVTVANPTSPIAETCTVANGSGTVGSAAVTNVAISCNVNSYAISGTVAGLASGDTLVVTNGGASVNVTSASPGFAFAAQASGSAYNVTAANPTSPVAQTCVVGNGSGTVGSGAVTNVTVTCTTNTYAVSGTVTGLDANDTLSLSNGGATTTVRSPATGFSFPAQPSGTAYSVTVTNPSSPIAQTCTVTNGSGTLGSAPVTNVAVACTTNAYSLSGTVTGLAAGDTLGLSNGSSSLSVTGTSFSFPGLTSGTAYSVTVTNPSSPIAQTCTVANGSGTVANANVTNVAISCSTNSYAIGGTVTGLAAGDTLGVSNGSSSVAVASPATTFSFGTLASGATYAITVTNPTSPVAQTCSVTNASGTVGSGPVSVAVSCVTNAYAVGGTVVGLAAGDKLVVSNGASSVTVASPTTAFSFGTQASGTSYAITVTSPSSPVAQSCTVAGGSGTVGTGPVSATVTCATNSYSVSGTVAGLGAGDTLSVSNGASSTTVKSPATGFSFPAQPSGTTYAVTVTNPTSPVAQSCTVANGSGTIGTANVTNVAVTCTTSQFAVSGTVAGLGAGDTLSLSNGNLATSTTGGTFAFAAQPSGTTYAVTVTNPISPVAQSCTVANGSGTIGTANVTNVAVTCTTSQFAVSGTVTGLGAGDTLSLLNGNRAASTTGGTFAFAAQPSGTTYAVTVTNPTSPVAQSCTVANGSGTIGTANVTNVAVTCTTSQFAVSGTVTGLGAGDTLSLLNGNRAASTTGGTFTFPAQPSGTTYAVTATNPTSPVAQSCTVTNGSGTVGSANVTNVAVNCTTSNYAVGGTVSGLDPSNSLAITINGSTYFSSNGGFSFGAYASGSSYSVSVTNPTSPVVQTCSVSNGSGTIGSGPVSNVLIACVTPTYQVTGSVSGLLRGASVTLANEGGSLTTVSGAGNGSDSFSFPSQTNGTAYAITVNSNPSSPYSETCNVNSPASGTISNGNARVTVSCTPNAFFIGGTISGLAPNAALSLSNSALGTSYGFSSNGAFSFSLSKVAAGTSYTVAVSQQPASPPQTCVVLNGSGVVMNGDVTNIQVTCTTNTYTVGGVVSASGAKGTLVLQNSYDGSTISIPFGTSYTGVQQFTFPAVPYGTSSTIKITSPISAGYCYPVINGGNGGIGNPFPYTVGAGPVTNLVFSCSAG